MTKTVDSKTLARALLLKLRASMAVNKDRDLIKKHLNKGN